MTLARPTESVYRPHFGSLPTNPSETVERVIKRLDLDRTAEVRPLPPIDADERLTKFLSRSSSTRAFRQLSLRTYLWPLQTYSVVTSNSRNQPQRVIFKQSSTLPIMPQFDAPYPTCARTIMRKYSPSGSASLTFSKITPDSGLHSLRSSGSSRQCASDNIQFRPPRSSRRSARRSPLASLTLRRSRVRLGVILASRRTASRASRPWTVSPSSCAPPVRRSTSRTTRRYPW